MPAICRVGDLLSGGHGFATGDSDGIYRVLLLNSSIHDPKQLRSMEISSQVSAEMRSASDPRAEDLRIGRYPVSV